MTLGSVEARPQPRKTEDSSLTLPSGESFVNCDSKTQGFKRSLGLTFGQTNPLRLGDMKSLEDNKWEEETFSKWAVCGQPKLVQPPGEI